VSKRLLVVIEDDWELKGNGLGNVANLQYLPALFLMRTAKVLGIQVTFMVDVAQQIKWREFLSDFPDLRVQSSLWDATVRLMMEEGFDVQLHSHPQWLDATYDGAFFRVGTEWNIGQIDPALRAPLLRDSVDHLHELLRPVDPSYRVHAFKAGSWGLQPSKELLAELKHVGVELVMGVRKDMHFTRPQIDYRDLDEDTHPYAPNVDDIRKLGPTDSGLVVVPLTWYRPGPAQVARLVAHGLKSKVGGRSPYRAYQGTPPKDVTARRPFADSKNPRSLVGMTTHLKIGAQPLGYLKKSFDDVIPRLKDAAGPIVPIVIETHTKDHVANYDAVAGCLRHLVDKHGQDLEFVTVSQLNAALRDTPSAVRGLETSAA